MENFAFLLKTYEKDIKYAVRLLKTFNIYNVDNLKCFVVLPKTDEPLLLASFPVEERANIDILYEEDFSGLTTEPIDGISVGYINQEIVKLSFWEKELAENYFCLDSDAVFIRKFYRKDFMYDEHTPYTVLFEDGDLKADPLYYKGFWIEREKALKKIQDALDFHPYKMLTCHGFQCFSSAVLCSLKQEFMSAHKYSYVDLMRIAPYEFSWYNFYLQKYRKIELHLCGEIFRSFHMKHHVEGSWVMGMHKSDLARSYVGIVVNGNFCNGRIVDYDDIWTRIKGVILFFIRTYLNTNRR